MMAILLLPQYPPNDDGHLIITHNIPLVIMAILLLPQNSPSDDGHPIITSKSP